MKISEIKLKRQEIKVIKDKIVKLVIVGILIIWAGEDKVHKRYKHIINKDKDKWDKCQSKDKDSKGKNRDRYGKNR